LGLTSKVRTTKFDLKKLETSLCRISEKYFDTLNR